MNFHISMGVWDGTRNYISMQITVFGVTVSLLNDGFWFRVSRWEDQGYWITWSKKQRFGERFGYEKAIWQIGKGKRGRVACFFLETPSVRTRG